MGNGFPGLAIVSVIALLVVLGAGALILQPWRADTVTPQLFFTPAPDVGLGDSVAVSPAPKLAVAPASPVSVQQPKPVAGGLAAGEKGAGARRLASVGPARAVTAPRPVPAPEGTPATPEATAPTTPTTPVAVPVATTPPAPAAAAPPPAVVPVERGGGPSGPIGAGAGGGEGKPGGAIEVAAGGEGALSFSFLAQPSAYRAPGEENLILRFVGGVGEEPSFGLQLWDGGSDQRGLWSSGDAMGGARFLAPVVDGERHQVVVDFKASSEGDGFYLVLLDGEPVDARAFVSLIGPGQGSALAEAGLFRDGERVTKASEVLFGPLELGETLESALP